MKRFLSLLALMMILLPTASAVGNVKIIDFSATATNGTVPLHTYFTGNVTGNVTNWHWKFQNIDTGNITYSSANVTAVHIFGRPGVYNVTLDVWGPGGNDTLTKVASVTANNNSTGLPVANFSASPASGNAPLNVSFTDNSTNATSQLWYFGNGNSSTEMNPTHNYSGPGNYTVILIVNNENGWNTGTQNITVLAQPVPPVANFSSDVSSGSAPLSVQFTDLSENATAWNWDFGDGATSTEQNPMHTYSATGDYIVNQTVSDANGTNSKLATINVL